MENGNFKSEREKNRELFARCSPYFIALGDKIRQDIILKIGEEGENGINVANLTSKMTLSRPAISHHLKVLKDSKLVVSEKVGTQIFYKLNFKEIIGDITAFTDGLVRQFGNC